MSSNFRWISESGRLTDHMPSNFGLTYEIFFYVRNKIYAQLILPGSLMIAFQLGGAVAQLAAC